jgi:peptide/nickel transport system ATP-binding protein
MTSAARDPLLRIEDLRVSFDQGRTTVVRDVSLTVGAGECVAIVGESGSGKSVTARSVLGLVGAGSTVTAGRLDVAGIDVLSADDGDLRRLRGGIVGLVSQDALVSLDPLRRVGAEVGDPLRLHRRTERGRLAVTTATDRKRRADEVVELLRRVGVPRPGLRARQYPHELSGGLRQRALVASAIAASPRLLIADEPTTALDMTVQAGILRLLAELRDAGTGLLLISHDLGVVSHLADRVVVMRRGEVVDAGTTTEMLAGGRHPYTAELVGAVPSGVPRGARLSASRRVDEPAAASRLPAPVLDTLVIHATGLVRAFGRGEDRIAAVDEVSIDVSPGETLGIVGESGSGKTTLARLLLALEDPDAGTVELEGAPWSGVPERRRRPRRRRIGAVAQDTSGAFDPRASVGGVIGDALEPGIPAAERRRRVVDLLSDVALAPDLLDRSPATLSGGQRQRVAIARALAAGPRVLVLDEPVSALDATVAAGVLDLLDDLQRRHGLAYLFISHDLGVVRHMSDRVAVMHDGRVVETGPTDEVLGSPQHDYTRRLVADEPRPARTDGDGGDLP